MRSQRQNAKRYFTAWGSILVTMVVAGSIAMLVIPGPTPEWALIIFTVVTGLMCVVFGFLCGATMSHVKQLEERAIAEAIKVGEEYA